MPPPNGYRNMATNVGNWYSDVVYDGFSVNTDVLVEVLKQAMDFVDRQVRRPMGCGVGGGGGDGMCGRCRGVACCGYAARAVMRGPGPAGRRAGGQAAGVGVGRAASGQALPPAPVPGASSWAAVQCTDAAVCSSLAAAASYVGHATPCRFLALHTLLLSCCPLSVGQSSPCCVRTTLHRLR